MINFNLRPYFDDFSEDKEFYKILFRPGFAVQARELTQIQSLLQNQIQQFGNNIFKQGAMVIPGQATLDLKLHYVKLQPTFNGADLTTDVLNHLLYNQNGNKELVGVDSGVRARVINFIPADSVNPPTIFVQYRQSGGTGFTLGTFNDNEDLKVDGDGAATVSSAFTQATGLGSSANISRGIYFVNGFFALVEDQTIILDPYNNLPSYRIGLQVVESIITPEDDTSLLDNAQGSSNFAAPGAHRYKIDLVLTKLTPTSTADSNFIQLMVVQNGNIQFQVDKTEYAQLEKTLARRTFDQAGDFTVRPFMYDVREHRNNDRGKWQPSTTYQANDVVTNSSGLTYQAESGGTSGLLGPTVTAGTQADGTVNWVRTDTPVFNRGVFTAKESGGTGDVTKIAFGVEPGKAYVDGFELEKIATEFIGINKARDFDRVQGGSLPSTLGNYVRAVALWSLPNIDKFPQVRLYGKIYDPLMGSGFANVAAAEAVVGSPIGTANIRAVEFAETVNPGNFHVYNIELINIVMESGKDFTRDVKSMAYDNGLSVIFSADIALTLTQLPGVITTSTSMGNTNITGINTKFTQDLFVGDIIYITTDPSTGEPITLNITTVTDDGNAIAAGQVLSPNYTTVPYWQTTAQIHEPDKLPAYFRFPHDAIRSVRGSDDTTVRTTYTVWREFTGTSNGSGQLTVTVVNPGETIGDPALAGSYTVTRNSNGVVISNPTVTLNSSTSVTISGLANTVAYTVIFPVIKNGAAAQENAKTPSSLQTLDYTTAGPATAKTLFLKQADIYHLYSVKMKTGSFTAINPGDTLVDITDRYDFHDGQQQSHYATAFLTLKSGQPKPTGSVRITFQYFTHGTNQDYFSTNSFSSVLDYSKEPFILPVNEQAFEYLDFRPTMTWRNPASGSLVAGTGYSDATDVPTTGGTGVGLTVDITTTTGNVVTAVINNPGEGYLVGDVITIAQVGSGLNATITITTVGGDYFNAAGSLPEVPRRGIDVQADYSFYLGRKLKIALDADGQFATSVGGSAINPVDPDDISSGMNMFKLALKPYTFGPKDVDVIVVDNKRYTMRDIGKLEKRIDNLEYFTALTALELDTKQKEITDSFGLNRFKAGFVVDAFNGHGVGDVNNPDYHCAVDMEHNELRPPYTMTNVDFIEQNSSNINRSANNYQITGDLITLKYKPVKLIEQPYASDTEFVNPFAVTSYSGHVEINPSTDDWFEPNTRPDILQNPDGNFDVIKTQPSVGSFRDAVGTLNGIWNAWQTQWTGSPELLRTSSIPTDVLEASNNITSRINLNSLLVPKVINQVINDRVLFQALVPFMRTFSFVFTATGMKPNTRMFPFFDKFPLDGTAFIAPATKIRINLTSTNEFDFNTPAGFASKEFARTDAADNSSFFVRALPCFNKGDVIIGQTTGSTAIVLYGFHDPTDSNNYYVYVMNIKGNFNTNEAIVGSISGATGNLIGSLATGDILGIGYQIGKPILSDGAGNVVGAITIVNTTALSFRTGIREFRISDSSVSSGTYTTFTKKQIRAQGLLESKQSSIISTRPVDIASNYLTESRNVNTDRVFTPSNTLTTVDSTKQSLSNVDNPFIPPIGTQTDPLATAPNTFILTTFGTEPLAQTIKINSTGGAFLTGIDLYFAAKDQSHPITVELREMVNGFPGLKVLPFSKKSLVPASVNTSTDGSVATNFTFDSPVYVVDGTEYAIAITSDSNQYVLYTGIMGDNVINSTRTISKQPYSGALFHAQNATTRVADTSTDLKFTVYRAQFNTNELGTVQLVNSLVSKHSLRPNPFVTTASSGTVLVNHVNHGMKEGSHVIFLNAASFNSITTLNGNTFPIHTVTEDSYQVDTSQTASASGNGGGTNVFASRDVKYDAMQIIAQVLSFSDTSLTWTFNGTNADYTQDGIQIPVEINDTYTFKNSKSILSTVNETVQNIPFSTVLTAKIATKNDAVSPVLDVTRLSMIAIHNRLDDSDFDPNSELILLNGPALSKYITKRANLSSDCTFLKIEFEANRPINSNILVYWRASQSEIFDSVAYNLATPDLPLPTHNTSDQFDTISYSIDPDTTFNAMSVKIVVLADNQAAVPRIKDLRITGCA